MKSRPLSAILGITRRLVMGGGNIGISLAGYMRWTIRGCEVSYAVENFKRFIYCYIQSLRDDSFGLNSIVQSVQCASFFDARTEATASCTSCIFAIADHRGADASSGPARVQDRLPLSSFAPNCMRSGQAQYACINDHAVVPPCHFRSFVSSYAMSIP